MTDNGLAALTTVLRDMTSPMRSLMGRQGQFNDAFWQREAAAILAPRGVFLPEGLGPVMVGMAKEIAALRDALDGLVDFAWHKPTCGFLRSSTVSHPVICNCGLTAALAAAKEKE